ncbi:S8 family peptidase [Laribacter hongkongensis]|uniref:S8 family peptidase n=1 Tax=Laribacter hongkongensis TaxID=168471 RepID=UPI001EFE8D0A|nr:S8 family peptidase [Laribacter hongkongensis]MCG8991229.1 S8 family peptidase [Laribacter hongkongensis]MCG8997576.1 S8 family peptidase [Laribacter hongkongensis]MCG9000028.1 S8 family peptidase [Laribacter hongkongensis]MCG9003683.1 S8 family peptidase [Laribacter hongkongensis]MCG9007916.1 S8 family peptidase [Laribacter hongkongensis]
MALEDLDRPHILPQGTRTREGFTAYGGGSNTKVPRLERQAHASALRAQLAQVASAQQQRIVEQRAAEVQTAIGIQVEFLSQQGVEMAAASLARDRQGIELMNVRHVDNQVLATVFIPQGKLSHFENLITEYVEYKTNRNGRPLDNQSLVDAISAIRVATFQSLWTDSVQALPENNDEAIWWEAWLPAGNRRRQGLADFRKLAERAGLIVSERVLHFPERLVVQVHGSKAQLLQSALVLNMIAELRRAKTTAEFFMAQPPDEQAEWAVELKGRLAVEHVGDTYVTLLDTGVNHGHPLLAPMVADADRHSIEPGWGLNDQNGHGTELAGLSLIGDLAPALEGNESVDVPHRLESVKILRWPGDNEGESYGAITAEAVGRVEITAPARRRVFAMAVSSTDGRDRGRPSSWSAEIDRLASDYDGQGERPRLFVLCAGNTMDSDAWVEYPASLYTNAVHDPGQSWNALTVGAYTQRTMITEDGVQDYRPIAPANGLSPYTTTSVTWQSDWPFKPDIVMEGGNAGVDSAANFASQFDSLSLLTTCHEPHTRLFSVSWATSAATALAAGMAARIKAAYSTFWPETVRALMVHSARWTQPMLDAYIPNGIVNRDNLKQLLRHCGYGVPSFERAIYSAGNSLTMVVQDQLQPFHKSGGKVRSCDMHLHALPWPTDILEALGDTQVTLRVTLSYFIEPNPGERGGIDKYAYQSHALRFEVRRPLESELAFRGRINAQAAEEEQGLTAATGGDPNWFIGKRLRARGSLLSDSWTGTAADLASRGQLAVYPAMGWWRNRPSHKRYHRGARYALVVSIEAPAVEQDLYASVAQQVVVQEPIQIQV